MPKCCIKIEKGKVVARQCTSGPCPTEGGWTSFEIDKCSDCKSYPSGTGRVSAVNQNVLSDVSQRLAFVQGQLSTLNMGGELVSSSGATESQEILDITPLFSHLRVMIKQGDFTDSVVEDLVATVGLAESGEGDLHVMLQKVCEVTLSELEEFDSGAYGDDDPAKTLRIRSFFDVISAAKLLAEMIKVPLDVRVGEEDKKCMGVPPSCQDAPRWRCLNLVGGGCISVSPPRLSNSACS